MKMRKGFVIFGFCFLLWLEGVEVSSSITLQGGLIYIVVLHPWIIMPSYLCLVQDIYPCFAFLCLTVPVFTIVGLKG